MEHPNPFELEKESQIIHGSNLDKEDMERVVRSLPKEVTEKEMTMIAEVLPHRDEAGEPRPGASYLGIITSGSKFIIVEIAFTGSLHASRTHRGEEGIRSNIHIYNTLEELLDPMNLTNTVRLRLGAQLQEIAKRRGLEKNLNITDTPREK